MMKLLFIFTFIFSITSLASGKKSISPNSIFLSIGEKYRKTKLVEMKFEKTLKTDLNPAGQKFSGTILLSKEFFRVETELPEKSLIVFDGKNVWTEQAPSADFPGPIQVSKSKFNKKSKAKNLIVTLLGGGNFTKSLKVKKSSEAGNNVSFEFESLPDESELKNLKIKMQKDKEIISEISYQDDIGNLTEMTFSEVKFKSKENAKAFNYTPPKGAQVTNL